MTDATPSTRLSGKAAASLLLGLLVVTAPLGLFLAAFGLRDINHSDGRLRGRGLALAGLAAGALGTVALVLGVVVLVLYEVRQRAAKVDCQNNLMHIGQALTGYHDKHGTFPAGTVPNPNLAPDRRLSFYVSILPHLAVDPRLGKSREARQKEWEDLAKGFALDQPWAAEVNRRWAAVRISWFHCPGDLSQAAQGAPALTSYVGIAGVGEDAASLPADAPNAGVFGYDRKVAKKQVTRGESHVMMVAETGRENGPWAAGGYATVRGLDRGQQPFLGPGRPFGGLHPGGTFVLYVDGSTRFLGDAIGPQVFESLATIHLEKQP